jgi:hypothetical protein
MVEEAALPSTSKRNSEQCFSNLGSQPSSLESPGCLLKIQSNIWTLYCLLGSPRLVPGQSVFSQPLWVIIAMYPPGWGPLLELLPSQCSQRTVRPDDTLQVRRAKEKGLGQAFALRSLVCSGVQGGGGEGRRGKGTPRGGAGLPSWHWGWKQPWLPVLVPGRWQEWRGLRRGAPNTCAWCPQTNPTPGALPLPPPQACRK